jgi:hypothetical protein
MFWFGHPFEMPLLVQSILMVGVMLVLIHACVELTYHPPPRQVLFGIFSRPVFPSSSGIPPRGV